MKLKRIALFATVGVLATMGVRPAHAENDEIEKATIPFEFYAETQRMPAGTYYFALDLAANTITISDSAGHYARFLTGVPAGDGNSKDELVFDRSGNSYFLKEFESDLQDLRFSVRKIESSKGIQRASAHVVVSATHS